MIRDESLDAANTRLAAVLKHANVARWPDGKFVALVDRPDSPVPFRFFGATPDEAVRRALRSLSKVAA